MPQAFQARKFFIPKTDPKQEVYKPVPYYFGTLSTQDAADQIAEESSLTKGDVLNVLDRYQRYVIKNLQKGYKVELLGEKTSLLKVTILGTPVEEGGGDSESPDEI